MRLAPGLDPELAQHLVSDSDPEWVFRCRQIGFGPLGDALQTLSFQLRTPSYSQFLQRRTVLEQATLRIAQGFARVYDFPMPERWVRRAIALSPGRDFQIRQLERRYIEVGANAKVPPGRRIQLLDGLIRQFAANSDTVRMTMACLVASGIELEAGHPDRHRNRLEAARRLALATGDVYVECQTLGELAAVHQREGHEDSLRACLERGIDMALRHGSYDQAARMQRFFANYEAERGRLARAFDHLAEARRLCERPGGDNARLRLEVGYAKFAAGLGCWDLVDRSLRRLPPLLREFPRTGREGEVRKHLFDAERLQARLDFANRQTEGGSERMERLCAAVPEPYRRVGYAELFDDWSEGLENADRTSEALDICERGLAHCDTAHVPEHEIVLRLRRARLLLALGRTKDSERALIGLERASAGAPRDRRMACDIAVLHARLQFHAGRVSEARREIRAVLDDFRRTLGDGDGGPLSYLEVGAAMSLHDAVHEIEEFTPQRGLAFEMEWRGLPARAARERRQAAHPGAPLAVVPTSPPDGVELVYRFAGDRLLRWTATRQGVVVDTLALSAAQCLDQVRAGLVELQFESPPVGALLGPRATRCLQTLSSSLLPAGVIGTGDRPKRISISADGPLLALPFEALPVAGSHGLQPLAMSVDVAYVRNGASHPVRRTGRPVIVSNPSLAPDLLRRHGWNRELPGSIGESEAARARWPDATVLSDDRATRDAVIQAWRDASIIYLAAHHVRDVDAPFLGFVPLATPPGVSSHDAFLEVADVHAMDLSRCRLAILASCGSGAPYRMALRPGVSLGDAVLDAGARAVVQSFWDVGDLETRDFMKTFLALWREDGDDAGALNQARRRIMATPAGAAPRVWAAWSLLESLPVRATSDASIARNTTPPAPSLARSR